MKSKVFCGKCHRTAKMFWLNHVEKCKPLLVFRFWISLLVIRVDLHAFWRRLPLMLQAHRYFIYSVVLSVSLNLSLYHTHSCFSSPSFREEMSFMHTRFVQNMFAHVYEAVVECEHSRSVLFFFLSLSRPLRILFLFVLVIKINEFPSYLCVCIIFVYICNLLFILVVFILNAIMWGVPCCEAKFNAHVPLNEEFQK